MRLISKILLIYIGFYFSFPYILQNVTLPVDNYILMSIIYFLYTSIFAPVLFIRYVVTVMPESNPRGFGLLMILVMGLIPLVYMRVRFMKK